MRARRRVPVTAGLLCLLAASLTGCDAPAQDQMTDLLVKHELPYLGVGTGIREVADWRNLAYPTATIRERFESSEMTYRVITAGRNGAELAVWITGQPGGEPFNSQSDVTATAHACVALTRRNVGATVRSQVQDCPKDLVTMQPSGDNSSWGRDSNAIAIAERIVDPTVTARLSALYSTETGRPRRTPPTRARLLAAATVRTDEGQTVATLTPQQPEGRFVADLVATATAKEALNERDTITGRRCYRIDIPLAVGMDATSLPQPVGCR